MRTTVDLPLPGAEPDTVFAHLELLDAYPSWMHLVHRVEPVEGDGQSGADARPAWAVELRARVGPFARSKRLRMERTEFDRGTRHVRFERAELDGREHANWILTADVDETGGDDPDGGPGPGALVRVVLEYTGTLWTGGVLERVLDDEIRRGRRALEDLVSVEPTR